MLANAMRVGVLLGIFFGCQAAPAGAGDSGDATATYLRSILARQPKTIGPRAPVDPMRPPRHDTLTDLFRLIPRDPYHQTTPFVIQSAGALEAPQATRLYAAFDQSRGLLMIAEARLAWADVCLVPVRNPKFRLPQMSFSTFGTATGLAIGSTEVQLVAKLGKGRTYSSRGEHWRLYEDPGGGGIRFLVRDAKIAGIWEQYGS